MFEAIKYFELPSCQSSAPGSSILMRPNVKTTYTHSMCLMPQHRFGQFHIRRIFVMKIKIIPQWHTSRSVYFQFAPYNVPYTLVGNIIKLIKWQLKRDVSQQIDKLMPNKCSFILDGNGFFYALHL